MKNNSYDFTPLHKKPLPRAVIVEMLRSLKAKTGLEKSALLIPVLGLGVIFLTLFVAFVKNPLNNAHLPIVSILGLIVFASFFYYRKQNEMIIEAFARLNNLEFIKGVATEQRPGLVFDVGHNKTISAGFRSATASFYEIANYTFETSTGRSSRKHDYGYIWIKLPRRLPHILLDAKQNNFLGKLSNLPGFIDQSQKLSLEGDFDAFYTLYVPNGYQQDALYILTPDIMQMFVDEVGNYDIEIVDDNLFIYSDAPFNILQQQSLQKIFSLSDSVHAQLYHQTDYYADDRVGDRHVNIISNKGMRLQRAGPATIALYIALVLIAISGMLLWFT